MLSVLPHRVPNPSNAEDIYCFLPSYYYRKRNIDEYKPYIEPFREKISKTGRKLHRGDFIMNVRVSEIKDIIKLSQKSKVLGNACLVYSMWLGYIEQDEQYQKFMDKMKELGIDVIYLHTSGHADYKAFKMLFDITKPDIAIPIHTEDKQKIKDFTSNAIILEDEETLNI